MLTGLRERSHPSVGDQVGGSIRERTHPSRWGAKRGRPNSKVPLFGSGWKVQVKGVRAFHCRMFECHWCTLGVGGGKRANLWQDQLSHPVCLVIWVGYWMLTACWGMSKHQKNRFLQFIVRCTSLSTSSLLACLP